ncbi:KPN_02809 family neutral zinc metallopeptidase [Demequina sp.]|uniref:KPN_02809 family neutral zinc metallopeptidase n=1 Tax=Demequina sp. TaxID=2050685 RepID=UPI003D11BEE3
MTFNEGSRIDASRVQRRRGGAGGGVAIGGGVGGIIIVLLFLAFQLFGGGDATSSLDGLTNNTQDETTDGDFAASCSTGADANASADCRVAGTIQSLDDYWADAMPSLGAQLALPGVVIFDASTQSGCGMASASTGPFYCPTDQTIYLDVAFFDELENTYGASGGPLAQMYVVAHEYGHHIENQLGVFDVANRGDTGADSDSVKVELMADCLAGVWAGHAATTEDADGVTLIKPLTEQDVNDALSAAAAVGDDRIQQQSTGSVNESAFTHGSAEQRMEAFKAGYTKGTATACDTFGVIGN